MQPYTNHFYEIHQEGSRRSARQIVPLILPLLQPKSVVDVGCGVGTWLSVFQESGINDFLGIDGDWVKADMLEIPREHFRACDFTQPLCLNRHFDLVVSVEVAEHLPAECAKTFIESLTRLGPTVLFSAAIPHQGGAQHLNEQWPGYWLRLFQEHDYVMIDSLRSQIWENDEVEWPYAQNLLLFVRRNHLESHPRLKLESETSRPAPLAIVHPKKYLATIDWIERLHQAAQELAALIPSEKKFIFVDDNRLGAIGFNALPFIERDGQYWGAPPDDDTATQELERMRRSGATFIAFAWPAFWWLDHYADFHRDLQSRYRRIVANERLVIFDLTA